jgi:hypothetical protein
MRGDGLMPHLILDGEIDLERFLGEVSRQALHWGRAVLKTDELWRRADGRAVLAEGVVVEYSRPQHPVAIIAPHDGSTSIRLWSRAAVERTSPVQRWLALLAVHAMAAGCGGVRSTNLAPEAIDGLDLSA